MEQDKTDKIVKDKMVLNDSGWVLKKRLCSGTYIYERRLVVADQTRIGELLKRTRDIARSWGIRNPTLRFGKDATEIIIEGIGTPID